MKFPGFIGPTYTGRSTASASDRLYNMYPEVQEVEGAKNRVIYHGRPGLIPFSTLGSGNAPVRAMYALNGVLYAVCGTDFYTIDSAGAETSRGTVSASGDAQIVGNGVQILIIANNAMHCYTISGAVFANISPGFVPSSITFMDSYFIASEKDTKTFWVSGSYDGTSWNALDFASKETNPDNLIGVFAEHNDLWLFGSETIETWYNSGNIDFPFEKNPSGYMERGCAAIETVRKLDNSLLWLASDVTVRRADGYNPMRISTHAVEYWLKQSSDLSAAIAWISEEAEGHEFYHLYVPDLSSTFVYDAATQMWHEESFFSGGHTPHLGRCQAQVFNKALIGSRASTGIIYQMDLDTYYDSGTNNIRRERICPYIHMEQKWIFFDSMAVDVEVGVGLDVGGAIDGYDPQMILRFSNDQAKTWSSERSESMGTYQNYNRILRWDKLGRSRNRVFRLYSDAPVKQTWIDASLELTPGLT